MPFNIQPTDKSSDAQQTQFDAPAAREDSPHDPFGEYRLCAAKQKDPSEQYFNDGDTQGSEYHYGEIDLSSKKHPDYHFHSDPTGLQEFMGPDGLWMKKEGDNFESSVDGTRQKINKL